jgi:protein-tyrosine phosphatase
METMVNVRDLGGYAAMDGKITGYGKFLRAECPIGISGKDLDFFRNYGITLSVDLRGNEEVTTSPSDLNGVEGFAYIHCPTSVVQPVLHSDQDRDAQTPFHPPEGDFDLGDTYIDIVETSKGWSKRVFEICAEWDGGILYHCFIGKDRAGIITALLLGICGVSETDIMMDYSASMSCLRPKYNKMNPDFLPKKRGRPNFSWGFFGSVPESMETLLCHFNEEYGGIQGYLKNCGVTEDTICKLRQKLLEDAV